MPAAAAAAADAAAVGRGIYERGQLPGGRDLQGQRLDKVEYSGAQAACSTCHRPSGMGGVEGDIQVPPITGQALFGTGDKVIATMDPRTGKAFNQAHDPYTEAQIAQLLRTGRRPDGSVMNELMPRYQLGDTELHSLVAYLHGLSAAWSPGVTADTIRLATVITPDVPATQRALFIEMAQKIVAQKNGSTKLASSRGTRHHMTSAAELVLGTERRWELEVWEPKGEPSTWGAQLDALQAKAPVFAVVSGLAGSDWGPIDAFCNRQGVPCWFPSVALPPAEASRWSIYFGGGVALEARVLAATLRGEGGKAPRRLLQVRTADADATGAAQALAQALAGSSTTLVDRVVDPADGAALRAATADVAPGDAVVFWLRGAALPALDSLPVPAGDAWFSGTLGAAASSAIPPSWRARARVVYPWELPAKRVANLAYFKAWLVQRKLPLVDETWQSEVFFSFAFLTDTLSEMLDNLYRDYLVERAESMINRREGSRAESEYYSSTASHVRLHADPAAAPVQGSPASQGPASLRAQRVAGSAFLTRSGTSAYPRLTLGAGQRLASKGAYVVRINDDGSLAAEGGWVVP